MPTDPDTETARRMNTEPWRLKALRAVTEREALVHARTDGETLYCGLPADAMVQFDHDVFVTCPGCAAEVRRRDPMNADADEVLDGLVQLRREQGAEPKWTLQHKDGFQTRVTASDARGLRLALASGYEWVNFNDGRGAAWRQLSIEARRLEVAEGIAKAVAP